MTDWTQDAIERRMQERAEEPIAQVAQVRTPTGSRPTTVVVTDIHMSFGSMVTFMVKWTIASIPALFILFLLGLVCWTIGLALFGGFGKH